MLRKLNLLFALAVLATVASGCSLLHHKVQTRPVSLQSDQKVDAYATAVEAISRRDYSRALDWLQTARRENPGDPRVINAFGVVYDKLGRFDLSARYYEQARALDPSSPVVAANIAYSRRLQQMAAEPTLNAMPVLQALQTADPAVTPVAAPVQLAPGLTGRPLEIVYAEGQGDSAQAVRTKLVRHGWTVFRPKPGTAINSGETRIEYPARYAAVAQGLARTLRGKQTLQACDGCLGVRLIIGGTSRRA